MMTQHAGHVDFAKFYIIKKGDLCAGEKKKKNRMTNV
jgi:hypothetical protein